MAFVLTNTGKSMLTSIVSGNPITYYLSAGINPSALTSAITDIALFSETAPRAVATVSAATTTTTNDTLKITGIWTPSTTVTLQEAGVNDSVTTPLAGLLQSSSTVIGSATGTSVVSNTPLSPGNGNYIQIRSEVMQVSAGSGTTTLTVVRGQNGTTPLTTLAANDPIAQGNVPGAPNIIGGNLMLKADYAPLTLTTGDTVVFTWEVVFA